MSPRRDPSVLREQSLAGVAAAVADHVARPKEAPRTLPPVTLCCLLKHHNVNVIMESTQLISSKELCHKLIRSDLTWQKEMWLSMRNIIVLLSAVLCGQ